MPIPTPPISTPPTDYLDPVWRTALFVDASALLTVSEIIVLKAASLDVSEHLYSSDEPEASQLTLTITSQLYKVPLK
ncbi:hypothetical protein F2P81_023984 [Scophthalmus maximus]|uniref:Uncharacterized protein n=1 Tax=Scophthalmus maximus TaxID=52904 RepID=A0A6A4RY13_SCOMX|nr:hypothetical protein F2P81_023984 [Scophthalmus maximus]